MPEFMVACAWHGLNQIISCFFLIEGEFYWENEKTTKKHPGRKINPNSKKNSTKRVITTNT